MVPGVRRCQMQRVSSFVLKASLAGVLLMVATSGMGSAQLKQGDVAGQAKELFDYYYGHLVDRLIEREKQQLIKAAREQLAESQHQGALIRIQVQKHKERGNILINRAAIVGYGRDHLDVFLSSREVPQLVEQRVPNKPGWSVDYNRTVHIWVDRDHGESELPAVLVPIQTLRTKSHDEIRELYESGKKFEADRWDKRFDNDYRWQRNLEEYKARLDAMDQGSKDHLAEQDFGAAQDLVERQGSGSNALNSSPVGPTADRWDEESRERSNERAAEFNANLLRMLDEGRYKDFIHAEVNREIDLLNRQTRELVRAPESNDSDAESDDSDAESDDEGATEHCPDGAFVCPNGNPWDVCTHPEKYDCPPPGKDKSDGAKPKSG